MESSERGQDKLDKEAALLKEAFYRIGAELFPQGAMFSPGPQDVMLVSYPKSGNTWIRALVAHLVGTDRSLAEMDHLVPDIYRSRGRAIRNAFRFPCAGRLIKSHECFRPAYKRIILVVRDPRDVCVSYYHYLAGIQRKIDPATVSLDAFVKMFVSGDLDKYGNWGEHTNSWLAAENADLLLLRYEDLLAATHPCLEKICRFLAMDADSAAIAKAVEGCSLEKLRSKERGERTMWHPMKKAGDASSFFRQGGSAGRTELDQESLQDISEKWRDPMKSLGYLS